MNPVSMNCIWSKLNWDNEWTTECGQSFIILDDLTPEENDFKFCVYCGKPLVQKIDEDEEDDNSTS